MIQLTRLNNVRLALNADLIKYVEQSPDTVITLLNGEKLLVRETTEQVIERVREYRRSIFAASCCSPLSTQEVEGTAGSRAIVPLLRAEGPALG
jgi:flagellar protein FlbD